jgi:hypothetical protein
MSAPAVVDLMARRLGLAAGGWGLDGQVGDRAESTRPSVRPDGLPERRRTDPVALLSREHDDACRSAVDSSEIAAVLEASGVNDRMARELYGATNVFELANELFRTVPRRLPEPVRPRDPWQYPVSRHLGRGVLYALPTLPYLAALRLIAGSVSDVVVLLTGSVLATASTHGVSYVGHLLVGYGSPLSAGRWLRRALLVTITFAAAALFAVSRWTSLSSRPSIVAAAELVYVVAATVIMVFERERLLVGVLVPAVTLAGVVLFGVPLGPHEMVVVVGAMAGCIAFAVVGALVVTLRVEQTAAGGRTRLVPQEVRRALLHWIYGAMTAGLLMYAVVDAVTHDEVVPTNTLVGIGMLPLVISLGITEWTLHGFRSDAEEVLYRSYDIPTFARRVRRALFRRLATYTAFLVVITVLVLSAFGATHPLSAVLVLRNVGYDLLGMSLFLSTVLVSCGLIWHALAVMSATLVADWAVRLTQGSHLGVLTVSHCLVFSGLLLVLALVSRVMLVSPLRFR